MKKAFIALLSFLTVAAPATAHKGDLIRAGKQVGPIKLYETHPREARRWFGEPTSRTVDERGCVKAVRLWWRGELKVFAGRGPDGTIAEVHVLDRTVTSTEHGDLTIHTRRGVRVGDSEQDVKSAYPNARSDTHRGHTHYFIEDEYDKIFIKVVDREVVALEAHPFEWC